MKERIKCWMAALVAIIAVTANAAWTFYPAEEGEKGVLTDGIWTLHAKLAKNSTDELEVNGSEGSFNGKEPSPINLTDIYDVDGKRYKAVAFETFTHHTYSSSTLSEHIDKLTEFIAPDCRKLAGSGCFKNCSVLTNVYLNSSVTNFANHRLFGGCSSLKLFYPRVLNIKQVPVDVFYGCKELTGEFSFPECTGNNGGGSWFNGCTKIESVKMPLMTVIPGSSFNGCTNLKHVEFSKDLTHISTYAFSGCTSLGGDLIRAMLNPKITKLGNNDTDVKYIFLNCSSFDGALEWNFPNLASTNVVGLSCFQGCTSLQKVVFKTYVYEIRGSAFCNLAPGAEIFMHPEPVKIFESLSVGNAKGPFIKVYIDEESEDEWVDVIDKTYHVMRKENFNNRSWSDNDGTSTRSRDDMVARMIEDQLMCTKDVNTGDVTINQRNVIAFCMQDKSGLDFWGYPCFWLIKKSKTGLKVIVR